MDVDESEVLGYFAEDSETKAIFIYLESFKRPKHFLEVAREVTRIKPIILLKGGSTQEGAKAAVAHTAAMASDDRISELLSGRLVSSVFINILTCSWLLRP